MQMVSFIDEPLNEVPLKDLILEFSACNDSNIFEINTFSINLFLIQKTI